MSIELFTELFFAALFALCAVVSSLGFAAIY